MRTTENGIPSQLFYMMVVGLLDLLIVHFFTIFQLLWTGDTFEILEDAFLALLYWCGWIILSVAEKDWFYRREAMWCREFLDTGEAKIKTEGVFLWHLQNIGILIPLPPSWSAVGNPLLIVTIKILKLKLRWFYSRVALGYLIYSTSTLSNLPEIFGANLWLSDPVYE